MISLILLIVAIADAKYCSPVTQFSSVCQFDTGPWHGTEHMIDRPFSHPRYHTPYGEINFTPNHGTPSPIVYSECVYPCYHAISETQGLPYWTGETESAALGAVSAKFGGLISNRMMGMTFSSTFLCMTGNCDIPIDFQGNSIFDLEFMATPHANRAAFVKAVVRAAQFGVVVCYASTNADMALFQVESGCSMFLWNGYDAAGRNQLMKPTVAQVNSLWYINHTLSIPLYGWQYLRNSAVRIDQCVQGIDNIGQNPTITLEPLTSTAFTEFNVSGVVNQCVFNTPVQIKSFSLDILSQPTVTSYIAWSNYPRNQRDVTGLPKKMERYKDVVQKYYPQLLGFNANVTTLARFDQGFTDVCLWVHGARIPQGVSCSPRLSTNNRPFYTCTLKCSANISYTTSSNMIPKVPLFSAPPDVLTCSPSFNGVFLSYSTPYAFVNDLYPCVSSGPTTTFCQTTSCDITTICSMRTCHAVTVRKSPVSGPLQFGRLERGEFYPPGHSRVQRQLSSYLSLSPVGSSMQLCHYSVSGPRTCLISDGEIQHTLQCDERECCRSLSPLMFASGTQVAFTCGHDNEVGIWDPWGSGTGSTVLGWVMGTFASQPWWIKFVTVIAIIWLVRVVISMLQFETVSSVAVTIAWIITSFTWDFPKMVILTLKSSFWGLRSKDMCSDCFAFKTLVPHSDAGCPYSDGSFCPYCEPCLDSKCKPSNQRHYIFVHMWEHTNLSFYLFPWNYIAKWSIMSKIDSETQAAQPKQVVVHKMKFKQPMKKSFLSFAVLALITRTEAISNIVGVETCQNGICNVVSMISQEGLWPGDSTCYNIKTSNTDFTACFYLGASSFDSILPVRFCRAETTIVQHSLISCASSHACANAPDIFGDNPNCTKIWDEAPTGSGYTDWGCSLPNVNSACVRAVVKDAGISTQCVVSSANIISIHTPLCMTVDSHTVCSTTGKLTFRNYTLTYTLETLSKLDFPNELVVTPDGKLRTYREDNGCFRNRRERFYNGPPSCQTGLIPPQGCQWKIRHWYDSSVVCPSNDVTLCESELTYPEYKPNCNVTSASPSLDGLSFQLSGTGCDHSQFKLSGVLNANVTHSITRGTVTGLTVRKCGGLSSTPNGASCVVYPECTGFTSCLLTTPINQDIPCGTETTVYFISTGNTTFTCSGFNAFVEIDLKVPSSDKFIIPKPLPSYQYPDISSVPIWAWVLLGLSIFFVGSLISVLIYYCFFRKSRID